MNLSTDKYFVSVLHKKIILQGNIYKLYEVKEIEGGRAVAYWLRH